MGQAWAGRRLVVLNWRDLEHPQAGGAEVFAERIAEQFALKGAEVTLLTGGFEGAAAVTRRRGYTIRRAGGTFGVYPAALRWLLTHRRSVDAVIDCQNGIPFFSPLVLPRRVPVVQVIHHVHQRQFGLFFGRLAAAVGRQLEARGARLVYATRPSASVSPSTRDEVRALLKLPGARYLVPNGVEPAAAAIASPRTALPSIVCVGRLVPHKRLELLLQALEPLAAEIPGLTVHIVGTGPDEAHLRAQAPSGLPPGTITWHGRLPESERDALLASAWLTVNTTHGEGWGIAVIEAAALGVPALAFNVAGMRDSVVPGTTGWLIEDGVPLAAGISTALTELADPDTAAGYRTACQAWANRFSWERSGDLMDSVLTAEWERLAAGQRERRRSSGEDVVAELDGSCIAGSPAAFRSTDLTYDDGERRCVLLYGADLEGAEQALARVAGGAAAAAGTRVRPAQPSDYLRAATG